MKKNSVLVIFIIAVFMLAAIPAAADSNDDYKVIKNAVKGKKDGEIHWFKITVFDKKEKKNTVKITLPITLVETLAECKDDKLNIKDDCDIELKTILKALKKHGPMTLIEIDGEDALVKIWFE